MIEVKDAQTLERLQSIVRNIPFFDDPNVVTRLYRAFSDDGETRLYRIVIVTNEQMFFCGLLSMPDGHVYLDWVGMKVVITNMIQSELDRFNAGHHWRYKGL